MPDFNGPNPRKFRLLPWLALGLILAILGAAIFAIMAHLRTVIVDQIARQDGYVLYAASKLQLDPELAGDPELRPMAIENQALEATRLLTNIIAMRLYDSAGQPQMVFPRAVRPGQVAPEEFSRAAALELGSDYLESVDLASVFASLVNPRAVPLLRVLVPLQTGGGFIGIAEFLMDGRNVQAALRELDRGLWRYGLGIFALGGGFTALSLILAFRRLQESNTLLEHRTRSLLRANHELTLAAKTSALGAITAHLIHDLKSPLFGLKTFVAAKQTGAGPEDGDWRIAAATTERMQKMINDVVRILQEEKAQADYELTVGEVLGLVRGRIEPLAGQAGLALRVESGANALLANREANLVALIVTNLAQNAVQATPRGGTIRIESRRGSGEITIGVIDSGPGLPESVRATLFAPARSTKTGGTGLGLAISKQLANHIGAELRLKETSEQGTTFELRLPGKAPARPGEFA